MQLLRSRVRIAGATLVASLASATALAVLQSGRASYDELTNTYRTTTNFNVETVRGMHVAPSGRLLMINTHGSTLNLWMPGGSSQPLSFWPTLNNPIAVDAYSDATGEYALVLGGGTHALALHELSTGRIVRTLQLPAETGDVVVDQAHGRAFVSCPGNNTVQQVGLPDLTVQAVFTVASQRPRFLHLDAGDTGDVKVYVTPELSGNNTASLASLELPGTLDFPLRDSFVGVLDFKPFLSGAIPSMPLVGLPDDDLFRIDPHTPGSGGAPTLAAVGVLRNAGTVLNAHGRNPHNGDYWIVGVEALNSTPFSTSWPTTNEPELKGVFARNQLVIAPVLGDGVSPSPWSNTVRDLDDPGAGYSAPFSVSAPYALAFTPSGYGVIAGVASDQLRIANPNGTRLGDLELPPGSIPRGVALDITGQQLFVYCWGTNEVREYSTFGVVLAIAASPVQIASPNSGLVRTITMGADPTSSMIRRGRELFYDADNSLHGRVTCHHCHPGGGMDLIGWNIHDFPHDHKDLMVTQSLKSIEDTFPYHWRGERDLEAFNAAFSGLLGGADLDTSPGGDFESFKAFVFSLQAHANPRQHLSRMLDPELATSQSTYDPRSGDGPGNPIQGQADMDIPDTLVGQFSCAQCHGKTAGTVGDPQFDDLGAVPVNRTMDVAHFRQLLHKNQDVVDVSMPFGAGQVTFTTLRGGYGLSHDGDHSSALDFLRRNPFTLTEQQQRDLAAFVEQADQGIAPAAHVAYTVDVDTTEEVLSEIESFVLPQAGVTFTDSHWVSFAIIGAHEDSGGLVHDLTWFFLPAAGAFIASDTTVQFPDGAVGSQTWAALKKEAAEGRAVFTLIGLPPGNALRFAVDPDDDGLSNELEALATSDPFTADSDDDGFPDGHEFFNGGDPVDAAILSNDNQAPGLAFARVDHTGSTYVKYVLAFNEPVTLEITATNTATGDQFVERRFVPRMWDSVTVQRLVPSLPALTFPPGSPIAANAPIAYSYDLQVKATDLGGNTSTIVWPASAVTRDQLAPPPFVPGVPVPTTNIPPAALSRVITELAWEAPPVGGVSFTARAVAKIRFDVPEVHAAYGGANTPNGSTSPDHQQVVVAQVLRFDGSAGTWEVLPMAPSTNPWIVSAPAGRLSNQLNVFDAASGAFVPTIGSSHMPGPFLLSVDSDESGAAYFDFTLNQPLAAGDKLKLNVVAILERELSTSPGPFDFWEPSMQSYNMPATAESNRGISWP